MGINPELLQKAAKVYEAAESVDGMQPKHVYESRKKCAPGEFNMHKEGYAQLQDAIKSAVDFSADKKMVAAAPKLTNHSWDSRKMMPERSHLADEIAYQQHYAKDDAAETAQFARTAPTVLGGLGGLVGNKPGQMVGRVAGQALSVAAPFVDAYHKKQELRDAMQQDAGMRPADLKNMPPQPRPQLKIDIRGVPRQSPPRGTGMGALRKAGAAEFGHQVKQALTGVDIAHGLTIGGPPVFTPGRTALMGAGGGGAAGAGLGGLLGALYGAYNPGDENTHNDHGVVTGQKRRGRLHGALRGLAGGGLLGGAAGAGLGGASGYINADVLEQARKRYQLEQLQNAR